MIGGDVALARLPQADGLAKLRPVVLLRQMPPFGDWLVCGVSSQLHHEVVGFDEIIDQTRDDFLTSGLKSSSLIRLGYLVALAPSEIAGRLGSISPERHSRPLQNLSELLLLGSPPKIP